MECAISVNLFIRVKLIVSPWFTIIVGPGTVPLKVQASYVTLVAITIRAGSATSVNCRTDGAIWPIVDDSDVAVAEVPAGLVELIWLLRLDIWLCRLCVVSRYTTPPTASTTTKSIAKAATDDTPLVPPCTALMRTEL
jgi:hypothetical protein